MTLIKYNAELMHKHINSPPPRFWLPFDLLGRMLLGRVYLFYELSALVLRASLHGLQNWRSNWRLLLQEVYTVALRRSLLIVLALSLLAGFLAVAIGSKLLGLFGDRQMLGTLLVQLISLESAPMLVAIIMISRSATVTCAELGMLRLAAKLDNPCTKQQLAELIFPKLAGAVLSFVGLMFYFIVFACVGGYLTSLLVHDLQPIIYLHILSNAGNILLVVAVAIKMLCVPLLIMATACFAGIHVGAEFDLGRASAFTVRYCVAYVIFFNVFISLIYYFLFFW